MAGRIDLPGGQSLESRYADATEGEDRHDGENDPAPVGESHDSETEARAGNPEDDGPAFAQPLDRQARQECLHQCLAGTERAQRKADPEAVPPEGVKAPQRPAGSEGLAGAAQDKIHEDNRQKSRQRKNPAQWPKRIERGQIDPLAIRRARLGYGVQWAA